MNIGMILEDEFPPDIRVEKEAQVLLSQHFNLHLLSAVKKQEEKRKEYKGILVEQKPIIYPNVYHHLLDKLNFLRGKETLFHKQIEQFVKRNKIEIIHAHDLPVAFVSLKIAKKLGIPIIADLHENYPYYKLIKKRKNTKRFRYWLNIEKKVVKESNFIITTCEEMRERILSEHCIPSEKIYVVPNYYGGEFENIVVDKSILEKYSQKFMILYSGVVSLHKGIETLIKSMEYLKNYPEIVLCIVGVKKNKEEFEKLAKTLHVEEKIEFIKWQPIEKTYSFYLASSVCSVPFEKNVQTDCSSPHKLFQYMQCKKPVLVSNCNSLIRIVEKSNCGFVFECGHPKDLADKILILYKNKKLRIEMGENSARSVKNNYNFEIAGSQLSLLYNNLTKWFKK
ncbi:MAG TPA: glycosyltransferase family 4 protein [bacterium]|nr:glycosyltransferase family 4 protein [bacterium]